MGYFSILKTHVPLVTFFHIMLLYEYMCIRIFGKKQLKTIETIIYIE